MIKELLKEKIKNMLDLSNISNKQKIILKNIGSILTNLNNKEKFNKINDYEFQIFSQFGDDGIIQYLISNIKNIERKFVEFGVENYEEANTRLLLEKDNWSGLIIDSSKKNISYIKKQDFFWKNKLSVICDFVTIKNINQILKENNFVSDIGILSIDIDGNDYWIWKEIEVIDPAIVIIEYNARFGKELSVTIPYNETFIRNSLNNLYYGASLSALNKLAEKKNYSLICTNKNGNNAYFVRNNLIPQNHEIIKKRTPNECFNINSFKENRDKNNNIVSLTSDEENKIVNEFNLEHV